MSVKARLASQPQASSNPKTNSSILIDTHVHIYDCFNVTELLQSAWNNFYSHQSSEHFTGVLLLTETAKDHWFSQTSARIKEQPTQSLSLGSWTLTLTEEDTSMQASNLQGQQLWLIAGRQIITAEKLEVLALITAQTFADNQPLERTLQSIQSTGGIAVLPWGVGKWIGKRGQLIDDLLCHQRPASFFLGDNSGRPQFWPRPAYFQKIEQQGRQILPGTDPLPIASEATRPGSFGLSFPGTLTAGTPAEQIKAMLLSPATAWQPYGTLEAPLRFVRNQLAMRGVG